MFRNFFYGFLKMSNRISNDLFKFSTESLNRLSIVDYIHLPGFLI